MRRLSLFAAALAVLSATLVSGQTDGSCPATRTLPDLIKAVDDAVSGAGNKDRTCMKQLFTPDGRLIPVAKGPDGNWAPHVLTVDEWIARVAKRGDQVFYERQIKYSIEEYGHIAHLWSTYEIRDTPDGKATARGINSMQAVYDGSQWRLIEVFWEAETPDEPVPAKFLP